MRIRSDPLIFGLPDPDPLLFHRIRILPVTTDIWNYFHLEQNIIRINKFKLRRKIRKFLNKSKTSYQWTAVTIIKNIFFSLKYIIIFCHFELRSDPDLIFFSSAQPDLGKKISDPQSVLLHSFVRHEPEISLDLLH